MRASSKLLALAFAAALQPALAAPVLNFEYIAEQTVKSGEKTGSHYAGVSFTDNAWSVRSRWGNCGNDADVGFDFTSPSNGGCGALYLFNGDGNNQAKTSFTMTVTEGFGFGSEFQFVVNAGSSFGSFLPTVQFLSATGEQLGDTILLGNPGQCGGNEPPQFCASNWNTLTAKFSGTAYQMVITGLNQGLLIDNINLQPGASTTLLPEPASIALSLVALGGVGLTRRRAAR